MIPPFQSYLYPFLRLMGDGAVRNLQGVGEALASEMNLTPEDLERKLQNSGHNLHYGRCGWARTWFMKAGLLSSPARGQFVITDAGRALLDSGITFITQKYLIGHYPSFAEFARRKPNKGKGAEEPPVADVVPPMERMDAAYEELENDTISNLLQKVKGVDPQFFEYLVVQLLVKMGYGGDFEDAAQVTKFSGDGGIDGVIKEDALGLDRIYVQAKRWTDRIVGAPDIQQFMGALVNVGASKGIYITTSHFTEGARKAAASGHLKLVLIDGDDLARYMLRYNLGVVVARTFEVKRVDSGFFNPEE